MGAANAIRAYATYGSVLGDHAMRVLAYMALVSADRDTEPWFGLGAEALSELALGRPVPARDDDPKEHEAALRSVGRALGDLKAAGAIRTAERAKFGARVAQNARYRLFLDVPHTDDAPAKPASRAAGQHAPSDAQRPVDSGDALPPQTRPSDAERPMASDAERSCGGETIGRSAVDHRTLSGYPQDAERPTKEERGGRGAKINSSPVGDRKLEGSQPRRDPPGDDQLILGGGTARARAAARSRARPDVPLLPGAVLATTEPDTAGQDPRVDARVVAATTRALADVLHVAVDAAWAREVASGLLAGRVVHSPASYVRDSILRDADPASRFLPPPDAPVRPPWCGKCDHRTRFVLDEHGFPSQTRCPTCGTPPARRAS